jgi:uncharacterized protein (TIGR02118 family)
MRRSVRWRNSSDVRHPSDVDAFERHYDNVHIPLAKQYPGLRRYTRSHEPSSAIGEPCYMAVMLDWDDMAALEAALGFEIGRRTAEGGGADLARYAISDAACARGSSIVAEAGLTRPRRRHVDHGQSSRGTKLAT